MKVESSQLAQLAEHLVRFTHHSLFLTGKAGTGKTTFLHRLREKLHKKYAIAAPTGVAALNAAGSTLHSLFGLPHGPFLPKSGWNETRSGAQNHEYLKGVKLSAEKKEMLKSLDLLVIDEVSMVRADLMDAIDLILRTHRPGHRNEPFGGLQLLLIGDLHQLPPVVKDDEWALLSRQYESPFFFDAQVFKNFPILNLELTHIYRQGDKKFINLLNNIRHNTLEPEDLEMLHAYYKTNYQPAEGEITLTTHNALAESINSRALQELPGTPDVFEGTLEGDFNEKVLPVEKDLLLKKGAQVMFLKNDKGEERRYYNGKIGKIETIDADKTVWVRFSDQPELVKVEKEVWRSLRYRYDEAEDRIEEEETGSYQQLPLRLAWAVTIHKSQGMTFDSAVIDAGKAFAAGQVYVALSRLRSLDGLTLKSRIHPSAVRTDARIVQFTESKHASGTLSAALHGGMRAYGGDKLVETFEWKPFWKAIQSHADAYIKEKVADKEAAELWFEQDILLPLRELKTHASAFAGQLAAGVNGNADLMFETLLGRIPGAQAYFIPRLEALLEAVNTHAIEFRFKKNGKNYQKSLSALQNHLEKLLYSFRKVGHWVAVYRNGAHQIEEAEKATELPPKDLLPKLPEAVASEPADKKPKPAKGESFKESVSLFLTGETPETIAVKRGMAPSTIESHLAQGVKAGLLPLHLLVSPDKETLIQKALAQSNGSGIGSVKAMLGDECSFGDIRAVIAYNQLKD
ncbi:MAG: helicase [Sphingobacteriales bacterium]|nr:MAG: helicase [Sphingobacteriales bacterium]